MNRELELAGKIVMSTGRNLFLTGKAGTGKTTFLKRLASETGKRMVILAPTGIAAVNAGGMTIHSFFQLPFTPYIPGSAFGRDAKYKFSFNKNKLKIIRSLDLIVIDEISMVRADLLDAVDDVLRRTRKDRRPFGGVQLLLIGDIHQLPPVTKESDWELLRQYYGTPFFFSSKALSETDYCCIELKHIYRQQDKAFVDLLNEVRSNRCTDRSLELLNSRYIKDFDPDDREGYIRLFTHNAQASELNRRKLEEIEEESFTFNAEIKGDFPEYSYPTDRNLVLKKGAQVMFVKNDSGPGKKYVNGTIGTVSDISGGTVTVEAGGEIIQVGNSEWTNARYVLNGKTNEIEEEILGVFIQLPLKLAWGITIHKSQGLTFEKAVICSARAFSPGQTYVALSRCRSLEGLVLGERISRSSIISNSSVDAFSRTLDNSTPGEDELSSMQTEFSIALLGELFGFGNIAAQLAAVKKILGESFYRNDPEVFNKFDAACNRIIQDTVSVSERFSAQYTRLSREAGKEKELAVRIRKAAEYFPGTLNMVSGLLAEGLPQSDNRTAVTRLKEAADDLAYLLHVKLALLDDVRKNGFSVTGYLKARAELSTADVRSVAVRKEEGTVGNARLYRALAGWRDMVAERTGRKPYAILKRKSIIEISNRLPVTADELLSVQGIGKKTVGEFGNEILGIILSYKE